MTGMLNMEDEYLESITLCSLVLCMCENFNKLFLSSNLIQHKGGSYLLKFSKPTLVFSFLVTTGNSDDIRMKFCSTL